MSKIYRPIMVGTVKYYTEHGEEKKMKLRAIKNVNITNSFTIPYTRGAVGLFNAILSRFMYFSNTKGTTIDNRKIYNAQDKIIFSTADTSRTIKKCKSQVYNIYPRLKRLFDLDISQVHGTHGARTVRLSSRVIEFLNIFTEEKLNQFILKYNITGEDLYILHHIYKHRIVRPTDGNLSRETRKEFDAFMKNRRHQDFIHYCSTNNVSDEARVREIELYIDFLSDTQKQQLHRIKTFLKETPGKLMNKMHWLLMKLQQYVTFRRDQEAITSKKSNQVESNTQSQVIDRNKTEGEQQKTNEVAAAHKKVPEDVTYQDIVQVATWWNMMSLNKAVDTIYNLTDKKIESIYNLVKSHGKRTVLLAIKNIGNLYHEEDMVHLIQFKDFIKDSENKNSRFNKVLRFSSPDTRLTDEQNRDRMELWFEFTSSKDLPVSQENIPEFNSKAEARQWFKAHEQYM